MSGERGTAAGAGGGGGMMVKTLDSLAEELAERDAQLEALARRISDLEQARTVAEAARDLIDSLTGAVAYSSGKWTAHGKDRALQVLIDAVEHLSPAVPTDDGPCECDECTRARNTPI